ncbi:PLP-dependent transferase [Teratosphaeria nubilosa]|uniref:PLP-dependent transferase n=1 Tax=Teratosphaeria nubilosa TaxID=161662 RepID=A0A6G1L1L9_9PEZI|nr:PLP-dependent transferase [Teratosphaeria nubilosa]
MERRGRPSGLESTISRILDRRRSASTIRQLTMNGPNAADFSSNDFLSLSTNPELRHLFIQELEKGPLNTGSGGSRLLDGNSAYAEDLEQFIANFHNAPAGLLCNSGFDANVGLFSCLPQPGDVVIFDEAIHASVHDGMKLSRAGKCICFAHNDVSALRSVMTECLLSDVGVQEGKRNIFVAVETVYSMDGDVAPLKDIVSLINELLPEGNGHLIVDEAHSTGIYGKRGRGLVCELGLEKEVTVRLHTFGKALAANGAILLCSPMIRQYLVNYARPLIYTTFMSFPALAAIRASYMYMATGKTEALARNLKMLIQSLHDQLLEMRDGLGLREGEEAWLRVPKECPETPIFAVLSSQPKALASYCQKNGFVVRGIVPPTVPAGAERIRVCLHAGNSVQQVENLVETIRSWVQRHRADSRSGQSPWARL